jgi:hypothetical protein
VVGDELWFYHAAFSGPFDLWAPGCAIAKKPHRTEVNCVAASLIDSVPENRKNKKWSLSA